MPVPKTYHIVTLGCPKNDVDSEHLERLLTGGELLPVIQPQDADAIVVNTCGFIEQSQEQSMDAVRELAAHKRDGQTLIVAGCMTQLYGRQVREENPGVDHIFGVGQWQDVAKLLSVDVDAIFDIPESAARVSGSVRAPSVRACRRSARARPCRGRRRRTARREAGATAPGTGG